MLLVSREFSACSSVNLMSFNLGVYELLSSVSGINIRVLNVVLSVIEVKKPRMKPLLVCLWYRAPDLKNRDFQPF